MSRTIDDPLPTEPAQYPFRSVCTRRRCVRRYLSLTQRHPFVPILFLLQAALEQYSVLSQSSLLQGLFLWLTDRVVIKLMSTFTMPFVPKYHALQS